MIAPDEPVVALLSLGSLRLVDTRRRTIRWLSGTHGPTRREADGPHRFARIVPWPPVPGVPATIVWDHTAGSIRSTRTSIALAAWAATRDRPRWTSSGTTVQHDNTAMFTALTAEAAHAMAMALASAPAHPQPRSDLFAARDATLLAGTDPLGTAASSSVAACVAALLNSHAAVDLLGAGIAVAGDPAAGGYQIDPTWQMRGGPDPWNQRVARAALTVGAVIEVTGTIDDWAFAGTYRHVACGASGSAAGLDATVGRRPIAVRHGDPHGPLAALGLAIDHIDALGASFLLNLALTGSG